VRTRFLATSFVVATTAGAMALAGCASSSGSKSGGGLNSSSSQAGSSSASSTAGGGGSSSGKTYTIGTELPLSGANAQLGINELDGEEIAVQQANADSSLGFKVKLVKSDDEGDPTKSPPAANQLIQNPAIIGVLGPAFSGNTLASGPIYSGAGMPFITASATNATLGNQGWKTYHRIVPNDNVEGSQGADWLARHGVKKLFVLQDLSTYGKGVGDTVAKEAKAKGVSVTEQGLDGTSTSNYNPIAQTIANSGADALFYGGYDAQAALLAKALKGAGFKGLTVGGNGIKSSIFTKNSGAAGNGWYMTCGCQDATVAPQSKAFAKAYQAKFHQPPSTYSPEAYDATNAMIQAIKTASASGTPTRASVEAALDKIDYKGITTTIKFQSNGEILSSAQVVNLYRQENGKIKELGNIKNQK
jgi:branched-chain amino acid transport system substrate-binding protein